MRRVSDVVWGVVLAGAVVGASAAGLSGCRTVPSSPVAVDSLSPPALAAALPDSPWRRHLVLSCTPCHQLRVPAAGGASVAAWEAVFAAMREIDGPRRYGTRLIADFDDRAMAAWVVKALRRARPPPSTASDPAVLREYPAGPRDGFYHDMEWAQGAAWLADFFGNTLYRVDPSSGEVRALPIPPPVGWSGPMGAHTINRTRDGVLWITFLLTGQVMRFDPATGQFIPYGGFDPHSHVHSFALGPYGYLAQDAQGRIWITHFTEEYLSRLDPATGQIERFPLPHSPGFEPAQVHPYAVSMTNDGLLWYTKLQANTLGVLDPATRRVQEIPMPRRWSGPRRLGLDGQGRLWIPEYTTNRLTMFDTRRRRFMASYPLPSAGDYPYAVRVAEATGDVWITGTGTDALYQFTPGARAVRRYQLPSPVAYTRMVTFDDAGNTWTVYGSFPNTFGPYRSGMLVRVTPSDERHLTSP